MSTERQLNVLVVDDSAVVRQTMLALLAGDEFNVVTAADPLIAMEKMRKARPDVMLLDLEMPRMDGLTFLRKVMKESPMPVIVCSAVAGRGTEKAIQALELGAIDIVEKPRIAVREFLQESVIHLTDAIRGAAAARRNPYRREPITSTAWSKQRSRVSGRSSENLIAIGSSTGGPEALYSILGALEETVPGIVIVQHMPRRFTMEFARSLNRACRIDVAEATSGDRIERGRALIAPGDSHLTIERSADGRGFEVHVSGGPLVSRHRPSVDILFRSAAASAGYRSTGILLTGMGVDGAEGLGELRKAGAMTIAQDEESSVVFGMPREAIRLGNCEKVLSLSRITSLIRKMGQDPSERIEEAV